MPNHPPMYSDRIIDELIDRVGDQASPPYTNVVFSRDDTVIASGAAPFQNLSSWCWYARVGDAYDMSRVDPAVVLYGIEKWGTKVGLKLIELETWNPYTQAEVARPNWITAVSLWRERTDNKLGFYRLLPDVTDNYFPPILLKRALEIGDAAVEPRRLIAEWMRADDANAIAVHRYVDFLCPQTYVQYSGDQEEWRWAIGLQLLEAVRLAQGKQVYPIVWHTAQSDKKPLTRAEFVSSLKYVLGFPGVDGIIVYDGGTAPTEYKWQDVIGDVIKRAGDFAIT